MPSAWEVIDCDAVQAGLLSCVQPLGAMVLNNAALVLRGSMGAVVATLARIARVIECTTVPPSKQRHLLARCLVRIVNGHPADIVVERPPARFWPGVYARMMRSSFSIPTYIPAHLVWSVYAGVFGRFEIAAGEWSKARFSDTLVTHIEPLLGFKLDVLPRVFVPDPVVLDLLLGAYLSPGSPLPADLRDRVVLEPCTGSGVLALALVALGATGVTSGDIDEISVACARRNVDQAVLAEQISVHVVDGLPSDNRERILVANPPWLPSASHEMPDYCFRCMIDPERRLLAQLLSDAAARDVSVAYMFLGKANPFRQRVFEHLLIAWRADQMWRSHGLRLHRLVRT